MRNKLKFSVLIVAILSLFTTSIFAQFSRNDAIDLVINTVLAADIGDIDVYCSNSSFTSDVELIDNDSPANPYADSWVFFSDDNPFASWYHSSRIIYVSSSDGSYTISNVEIYPKGLSSDYEEISLANRPDPVAMDGSAFVPDPQKVESNYNYALIIVTMDNERNWYNTSLIYNVLMQNYNYKADNIFVLYNWDGNSTATTNYNNLDGEDPVNDIDGPATFISIQSTISSLTNDLKHGNQLAVFFTGVPVDNSGVEPLLSFPIDENTLGQYPVSDISTPMADIACGQMILMFDINSSTDVAAYFSDPIGDEVACPNRYLLCSTFSNEENQAEMYFSGGNYSEQLFYWASAARGYLPDVFGQAPWNIWEDFGQLGEENGGALYSNYIIGHPGDTNLDDNMDGFIQMGEAFQYANDMNTWSDNGYCYIPFEPGESNYPSSIDEIPFIEDLISLSGLCGHVSNNQSVQGNFIISHKLELDENVSLSFDDNSKILLNGQLVSNYETSTLSLLDGTIVEPGQIIPTISVSGSFSLGENVTFNGTDETLIIINIGEYHGLNLNNVTLNHCWFNSWNQYIEINNCEINDSELKTKNVPTVIVNNSTFEGSTVFFDCVYPPTGSTPMIHIQNCTMHDCIYDLGYSLKIRNFQDVYIHNNIFKYSQTAVQLWDCGFSNNEAIISNNTFQFNFPNGLILYNTIAKLTMNKFLDNRTGLILLNGSSAGIWGDKEAGSPSTTQYFYNNTTEGIYVSHASFYQFRANAFECAPLTEWVYIYHTGTPPPGSLDVKFNYWGSDFKPQTQLLPDGSYTYEPIWNPGESSSEEDAAKLLYDTSNDMMMAGNYAYAEAGFKEVVAQYPLSNYSRPSLKKLFVREQYSGSNYSVLKFYLLSNIVILNNSDLQKSAEKIANQCDIAAENWIVAIDWLENEIQNPDGIEDSIYSIIDIGNVYLLMQNSGNKSSNYVGKFPEYKPKSRDEHFITTDELLKLLPRENSSQEENQDFSSLKPGELLQNAPNPVQGTTKIWYKLESESRVELCVYNSVGQLISTKSEGEKTKGTHHIDFDANGLKNGVYFYSISINGQTTDSKKMTIMK